MTTPPPAAAQTPPPQQITAGQIVAILAAGLAAKQTLDLLTSLLSPLGIGRVAVKAAFAVAGGTRQDRQNATLTGLRGQRRTTRPSDTAALDTTNSAEHAYRAAFLHNAAQRIQRALDGASQAGQTRREALAQALVRERALFAAHRDASTRRRTAAIRVDQAARTVGIREPWSGRTLLGWKAVHDARTDPTCRLNDGANFYTDTGPFPGTVHPSCRCRPVRPYPTSRLVAPSRWGNAA